MILLDNEQEDLSEQLSLMLWKPLTSRNTRQSSNSEQADKEDDIEGNDKFKGIRRSLPYLFQL